MRYPVISDDPEVQARYVQLRARNQSHKLAEMLATRKTCMATGLDRSFLEGKHQNHGLPDGFVGEKMLERARKAGINPHGKVYISQLARNGKGPTDPQAWVSGVDDVRDTCKRRGLKCEGAVKTSGAEPPPPVQCRLAEDLVQEMMNKELKQSPGKAADLRTLREEVIERHGQKKDDVNFLVKPEKRRKKVRVV